MKKPINYVVEVDIRKFFDNINHYWLQRCLEERILDKNFMWLIRRLLKAGATKDGVVSSSDQGITWYFQQNIAEWCLTYQLIKYYGKYV